VGYTCAELRDILLGVDYGRFVDHGSGLLQRVRGTPLYSLDYLLAWLRHLMQAKGAMTFGDLRSDAAGWAKPSERYRLIVFATELTSRGRVRLPIDITGWGREPDELELAWAVSATLAEPGLFEPVKVQTGDGKTLALGGDAQLDVHEVGVFDRADGQAPQFPTFGAWLISDVGRPLPSGELDRDRDRTIMIPVPDLSTTEFAVSREQLISLYDTGRSAAERFLASWDFARYLEAHGTS
jgi:NTE family protein